MSFVVTLGDLLPLERADDVPWASVEIAEAPDNVGVPGVWTSLETQDLDPVDTDPANPIARTVTTALGTLEAAWYRVRWLDADAGVSRWSDPVYTGDPEGLGVRPTLADVAALVRARTKARGTGGRELGTFTTATRPTADDVEGLISEAIDEVLGKVQPAEPGTAYERRVKGAVRLYTAMLIELSYFPEQVERGQSPYESYKALFDSRMKALIAEGETGSVQGDGDEGGGAADASWWFPEDAGGMVGWGSRW